MRMLVRPGEKSRKAKSRKVPRAGVWCLVIYDSAGLDRAYEAMMQDTGRSPIELERKSQITKLITNTSNAGQ